jgi:hypothetical protein
MKTTTLFATLVFASMAMIGSASATECPLAKHRPVHHRHVGPPPCPPQTVVQTPAPAQVVETPVKHVTNIIEEVHVKHVVIEEPTRVIAPRPCCAVVARPKLECCPPGRYIPGLPPCAPQGFGFSQGMPTQSISAQPDWKPSVDCAALGGTRTINPNTGKPSCYVPPAGKPLIAQQAPADAQTTRVSATAREEIKLPPGSHLANE